MFNFDDNKFTRAAKKLADMFDDSRIEDDGSRVSFARNTDGEVYIQAGNIAYEMDIDFSRGEHTIHFCA